MSIRVDTTSLIPGAVVVGDRGLGVLGSVIRATTATGSNGPGLLYPDLDGPEDDTKEFICEIVTPPSSGNLYINENGSFIFSGAPDGGYTLVTRLKVDGVILGTSTTTLTIGVAIYRPGSDEVTASWTATPGPAYFDAINESVANDTDYITSPELGATSINSPIVMGLSGTVPAGTWGLKVKTLHETGIDRHVYVLLLNSSNQIVGEADYTQTLRDTFEEKAINVTTNGPATKVVVTVANGGQSYVPPYSYYTP